jgi:aminoglycoside phosphotransferase (APT) family kinase protein
VSGTPSGREPDRVAAHRELIAALFPQLELTAFEPIPGGWTCDTYRVDDEWIVQLPRSRPAEDRLRLQIEVLPELAREVSASVPDPQLVSLDPVCMGYRSLAGGPCDARGDRGVWPERLGRFLYDLHLVPPELVGMRATSAEAVRASQHEAWTRLRAAAEPYLAGDEERRWVSGEIERVFDDDAAWRFAPCLTHGDLGPEHVLVTDGGDLSGVLDWEEVGVGDPAIDFAWWLHAMPAVGERALAAYGGVPDAGFVERARLAFVVMPLYELGYGLESHQPAFVRTGLAGFRDRSALLGRSLR